MSESESESVLQELKKWELNSTFLSQIMKNIIKNGI